jgi:beta-lactamase superfamily II metal-dependent hydrolase
LPEIVRRANGSLRTAGNNLSLALHEDNRFLFLGDLEKREIGEVAAELQKKRRITFFATITPHHGTHWHSGLKHLT